ncbi:MAG: hypothetical protein JNL97_17205, partial [Verrucomicrobiales bacterium]|nr:hypothetical protein [Verrucomicrobiales bacterium]
MRSLLFRYAAALVLGYAWSAFVPARGLGTEPEKAESGLRHDIEGVQHAAHRHPDGSPSYFAELERGFLELQRRYPAEAEIYAELLFVADHRQDAEGAS